MGCRISCLFDLFSKLWDYIFLFWRSLDFSFLCSSYWILPEVSNNILRCVAWSQYVHIWVSIIYFNFHSSSGSCEVLLQKSVECFVILQHSSNLHTLQTATPFILTYVLFILYHSLSKVLSFSHVHSLSQDQSFFSIFF